MKSSGRRLRMESLESRQVMSTTQVVWPIEAPVAATKGDGDVIVVPQDWELVTDAEVPTLPPHRFHEILPAQIRLMTRTQIEQVYDGLLTAGQWPGESFKPTVLGPIPLGFTPEQIGWLRFAGNNINPGRLAPGQMEYITPEQIRTMIKGQFLQLPATQVRHLERAQVLSVDNDAEFSAWTGRFGLTEAQVQWLDMNVQHVFRLSPQQILWLTTDQLSTMPLDDLKHLPVEMISEIPPSWLAEIHDHGMLGGWSKEQRGALTEWQVQALDVSNYQINLLTDAQRDWLTDAQLAMLKFSEYRNDELGIYLTPEQIRRIPAENFAKLPVGTNLRSLTNLQQTGYTREQLFSLGTMTPGDFDQDGAVDGDDLSTRWQTNFGRTDATNFHGDADDNGLVDGSDFLTWQRRLGAKPAAQMWDDYMLTESTQKAPIGSYTPYVQLPIGADGLPDAPHIRKEKDALFALVPAGFQTHAAVADGPWSSTETWGGPVPGPGAKVLIPTDRSVTYDYSSNDALHLLRVDGTLTFAHNANTLMVIDTFVVDTNGTLHIGTAEQPIGDDFTARIEFPVDAPIDEAWDPTLVSRGLLSRGQVRMYGKFVTPFVELSVHPSAGATQLTLSETPRNWNVGDRLVIAGVDVNREDFGVEERTIAAISGNVVTLDSPLVRSHVAPTGYDFKVHVANLKRNIEFAIHGMDPEMVSPALRPHIFFLHNPDVQIDNIHVNGFGRTDKTRRIVEPAQAHGGGSEGEHLPVNARGRYALHFHHTGVNPAVAPRTVRGSALVNGPGWGYVNHQSYVEMENNFAHNFSGASFVTEDGNEIGSFRGNLSIGNSGLTGVPGVTPADSEIRARADIHDFGHSGNGFWLQGPGVKLSDNFANAAAGPGFAIFGGTDKVLFDAVNLSSPALAAGRDAVPVDSVPLSEFVRNTSYGVQGSFDLWYIAASMPPDHLSVVEQFTSWNQRLGAVAFHYTKEMVLRDSLLIGNLASPQRTGVFLNSGMDNFTLEDTIIRGFDTGLLATSRGVMTVRDTTIQAVNGVKIPESFDALRKIRVEPSVVFETLTSTQLAGRQQRTYFMEGSFSFDYGHLTFWAVTAPVDIQVHMPGVGMVKLYFNEQAAAHVPFSTLRSPAEKAAIEANIEAKYRNKTNAQLWSEFGVAYASEVAPLTGLVHSLINGLYEVLPVQDSV